MTLNRYTNVCSLTILGFILILKFNLVSCSKDDEPKVGLEVVGVTKWLDDYTSAYSATYDAGTPSGNHTENQWLIDRGLAVDYEIVSNTYMQSNDRREYMSNVLLPNGFGVFGHGHTHIYHDNLSQEEAYESFHTNFVFMQEFGLTPISYAYPLGAGLLPKTRQALKDAGFLNGRLFQPEFEGYGPYITPGDETVPPDWYALPSLRMEDVDFQGRTDAVNNPFEFKEYIDENIRQRSWIISTYHGIGYDGETEGRQIDWGFYRRMNFYEEMLYIKQKREQGQVWLASMDDITLYILQRNAAVYELERDSEFAYTLYFDDGLDDTFYHLPLTLRLSAKDSFIGKTLLVFDSNGNTISIVQIESSEILINLHPNGEYYSLKVV